MVDNKKDLINALVSLKNAFRQLDDEWERGIKHDATANLNKTKSLEIYPFKMPFNHLVEDVEKWVSNTVKELE